MDKIKRNRYYYLCLAILFYILPLFIKDTGTAMMILLSVIPIGCFAVSVLNGMKVGFNWQFLLGVPVLFLPTLFIFYNISAWIYVLIFFVVSLIGIWIGSKL